MYSSKIYNDSMVYKKRDKNFPKINRLDSL